MTEEKQGQREVMAMKNFIMQTSISCFIFESVFDGTFSDRDVFLNGALSLAVFTISTLFSFFLQSSINS